MEHKKQFRKEKQAKHHSPDKEPYNTLRERRKEKLSLWTTASALYNKEYQGLATEFAGPSAK